MSSVAVLVVAGIAASAGGTQAGTQQAPGELPSQRSETYRTLDDYLHAMSDLASLNPDLVRPLTLPNRTFEGRPVEGIEITTRPEIVRDGKPVFLLLGLHHGREWPSGELTLEWAYDLIARYREGDPRFQRLVEQTRTIIVPVVSPDSFNDSREAGERNATGANGVDSRELRRKNCRIPGLSSGGCPDDMNVGVDVNRNYGGLWSPDEPRDSELYGGRAPFSEPEARNVRHLIKNRAVVTIVSNHTRANEIYRPSLELLKPGPDAQVYKSLVARLAAETGYGTPHHLSDNYGVLEDWSYSATGGFGLTIEIGENDLHPPFAEVVREYTGQSRSARRVGGGGNRAAYLAAQRHTADAKHHGVLRGTAPPGAVLVATRRARVPTRRGLKPRDVLEGPRFVRDRLTVKLDVPPSGSFAFHLNPSVSPVSTLGPRFRRGNDARWTLRCEGADGMVLHVQKVKLLRGHARTLDLTAVCGPRGASSAVGW